MLIKVLISLLLSGHVTNDIKGVIGIRVDWDSRVIARVHHNSPADLLGIKKNDKIIAVDDDPKKDTVMGEVNEIVKITIRRGSVIKNFWVRRVSFKDIKAAEYRYFHLMD